MIRRREFIAGLGSAVTWPFAQPLAAEWQRRVGALSFNDSPRVLDALWKGLETFGWVEGRNLRIDYRIAVGEPGRLTAYAEELVDLRPDVIFAFGGPAAQAELNGPHSLAVARNGDVYIADTWNNQVRRIDASTRRITRIVGTGNKGFSGDGGPAAQADFGGIYCIALDEAAQTLDLADLDNRRIRRVNLATGLVTTIAGNGKRGVPADGADARCAARRAGGCVSTHSADRGGKCGARTVQGLFG